MSLFNPDDFAPLVQFNPDPDVVCKRMREVAVMKQEMGSAWVFHHDNFIKMVRNDTLLTKWIKTL